MKRVGMGPLFRAKGHWYDPFVTGLGASLFALAGCFIGWELVAGASGHAARLVALALAAFSTLAGVVLGAYVGTVMRQAQAPHERTRAHLLAGFCAIVVGALCWQAHAARRDAPPPTLRAAR